MSTGREVQEMSLERVLEEQRSAKQSTASFLNNRVELDVAIQNLQRDTLRDNDDYQLITDGSKGRVQGSSYVRTYCFSILFCYEIFCMFISISAKIWNNF